jgi:hypothetical protein
MFSVARERVQNRKKQLSFLAYGQSYSWLGNRILFVKVFIGDNGLSADA